jgi:hypothetical protein
VRPQLVPHTILVVATFSQTRYGVDARGIKDPEFAVVQPEDSSSEEEAAAGAATVGGDGGELSSYESRAAVRYSKLLIKFSSLGRNLKPQIL